VDSIRALILGGTVKRIATSANESSVDRTRVFPVDVYLDEADPRLRPGMSATVNFTLAHVEDTPAVPLSAVFSTAESMRYVFVHKGERFEVRVVETGIADTRRVQILGGLNADEEVALMRPLEFDGEVPVAQIPAHKPRAPRKNTSS
jgi:HlyD family secretion protein